MLSALQIFIAVLLDHLLGDPRWLPHPVRFIGKSGARLENFFRKTPLPLRLCGVFTVALMLTGTGCTVWGLLFLANRLHPSLSAVTAVVLLYTTIAARDLYRHSTAVYAALQEKNLAKARKKVAMIVGRDTSGLDQEGVARAAVESVAESLVDGVCAPLFYAFLGGPIAAMCYKAINTADSMFGYKNERYKDFGWAGARLDDLANFIPARLTGLIIPLAAFLLRLDYKASWRIFLRDRLNHASPNSAHSEAAVAGALNIQLGGTNIYFGREVKKPTIGDSTQHITAAHILRTNRLMLVGMILFFCLMATASTAVGIVLQKLNFPTSCIDLIYGVICRLG
ncbi:MAG: adenosylcobinamide-phosphate synthase CbiB [Desulfobulbaceae bacterium]|nr:adenosylcobinamide-phosphate synthase CbiB [Desulfobulbaceae bacterium]